MNVMTILVTRGTVKFIKIKALMIDAIKSLNSIEISNIEDYNDYEQQKYQINTDSRTEDRKQGLKKCK